MSLSFWACLVYSQGNIVRLYLKKQIKGARDAVARAQMAGFLQSLEVLASPQLGKTAAHNMPITLGTRCSRNHRVLMNWEAIRCKPPNFSLLLISNPTRIRAPAPGCKKLDKPLSRVGKGPGDLPPLCRYHPSSMKPHHLGFLEGPLHPGSCYGAPLQGD